MPTNLTGTRISDTYQQVLHVSEGVTTEEKPVVSGTGVASTIRLGTESMSARQLSLDVPLAITSGGTDANNPPDARYNLGCGDVATTWYPDPPDGTVFLAGDATWKPAGGGGPVYRGTYRLNYGTPAKTAVADNTDIAFAYYDDSGVSINQIYSRGPDNTAGLTYYKYSPETEPTVRCDRAGIVMVTLKIFFNNSDSSTHYVIIKTDGDSRPVSQKYAIPPGGGAAHFSTFVFVHPDMWYGPGGIPAYDPGDEGDPENPDWPQRRVSLYWQTDSKDTVTYTLGSLEMMYMYEELPYEPS